MPNIKPITVLVKKWQKLILCKATVLAEASVCWHECSTPKGFDQQTAASRSLHPNVTPPCALTDTVILVQLWWWISQKEIFHSLLQTLVIAE